jgi:hypothetical protein
VENVSVEQNTPPAVSTSKFLARLGCDVVVVCLVAVSSAVLCILPNSPLVASAACLQPIADSIQVRQASGVPLRTNTVKLISSVVAPESTHNSKTGHIVQLHCESQTIARESTLTTAHAATQQQRPVTRFSATPLHSTNVFLVPSVCRRRFSLCCTSSALLCVLRSFCRPEWWLSALVATAASEQLNFGSQL